MVGGRVVRIPLESYRVPGIAQPFLRAMLTLWVRTQTRQFADLRVRVDSGAAITTVSLGPAQGLGLLIPKKTVEFQVETATGKARQVRHPGRITVRLAEFPGREFNWPCHFLEHQGVPPQPVLGLTGVLDDLRICLDGSYTLEAPYGSLVLEEVPLPDET
jgi:hypothetical protein